MNIGELVECFAQYKDEYRKTSFLKRKETNRPDLHAFLLLDKLVPGMRNIVSCAEHDKIWLDIPLAQLASVIEPEQVRELVWCGVCLDEDTDSLTLFV